MNSVGVFRQGRWLIRNVDLTVSRGEILTLIGPNGAGKSTTAKTALGVLKPDEGSVRRNSSLRVGYVPQKLTIDWTMPLSVNRLMSLTTRPSKAEISSALEAVGIPHLQNARVQGLSGGEFQRALIARALLRRPDLLVMDEPIQGVDYSGEVELYNLILKIRDDLNCGVLLISHDLHMVMAQTDTVICLNGHVCCTGTPQLVAASSQYQELFGRVTPPVAYYQHHHDHTHLPDGEIKTADGPACECTTPPEKRVGTN
ncbi:metal ABC transporter ATP-binding protein [Flexibacterium corallicola]|uniref:metal ABC transporter ATP-binding protein n=1 Tax=Flexibacterium corallicola TaxID=3037259 RepID=UPI00286ED237|nr:metal ABC transporter ATP-binding protein [Pseudovibrio sp. M1P-2-3]